MMCTSSQEKCWVITIICKCTKTILSLVVLIFCLSSLSWFLSSFFAWAPFPAQLGCPNFYPYFLPELPIFISIMFFAWAPFLDFSPLFLPELPSLLNLLPSTSVDPCTYQMRPSSQKRKRERYDLKNRILWKLRQKARDIIWRIEYFENWNIKREI